MADKQPGVMWNIYYNKQLSDKIYKKNNKRVIHQERAQRRSKELVSVVAVFVHRVSQHETAPRCSSLYTTLLSSSSSIASLEYMHGLNVNLNNVFKHILIAAGVTV